MPRPPPEKYPAAPLLKERGMNKVNIPPPNNFRVIRIQTEYARSIREITFFLEISFPDYK